MAPLTRSTLLGAFVRVRRAEDGRCAECRLQARWEGAGEAHVAVFAADDKELRIHGMLLLRGCCNHSAAARGAWSVSWVHWAASVEPCMAVVEDLPPEIAMPTASK